MKFGSSYPDIKTRHCDWKGFTFAYFHDSNSPDHGRPTEDVLVDDAAAARNHSRVQGLHFAHLLLSGVRWANGRAAEDVAVPTNLDNDTEEVVIHRRRPKGDRASGGSIWR